MYIPLLQRYQRFKGLDNESIQSSSLRMSCVSSYVSSMILPVQNDAERSVLSPYISRCCFSVVEVCYWLSSCSLEGADWFHSARCPALICTHQFEATSSPCPPLRRRRLAVSQHRRWMQLVQWHATLHTGEKALHRHISYILKFG